jgi:signal transduction histidine kinase
MFRSATLKLTAWYLAILMVISILFSVAIYQITFNELSVRLQNLQRGLIEMNLNMEDAAMIGVDKYRLAEIKQASQQMMLALLYVNLLILVGGGVGSYYLARRTLQPIENAHNAMSRFTSDASHELRTPLAAMKTELEVALRDPDLSYQEMRELLESSLEEANKLIKLSEVFLKLARLDYDAIEFKSFDLVETATEVIKRYTEHEDRLILSTRKKAMINGNEPAIAELFTILIENALKYSPPDTPITIKVSERRTMALFSISNQGAIIPEAQQERLFERFYRGDASRTSSARNGYGLGLAIAKRITDVHYGDIKVVSTPEHTMFTVSLPSLRNLPAKMQNANR